MKVSTACLNRWAAICTLIGIPLALVAIYYAVKQIHVSVEIAASQNYIALNSDFFSDRNLAVIEAIYEERSILKENGGDLSDFELDNYLSQFETINSALEDKFLSEHNLCNSFSYYILIAGENQEIQNYIKSQYLFSSLDKLYTFVKNSKDPLCH